MGVAITPDFIETAIALGMYPPTPSSGGTVTNIATGAGLTGGPITTTGTISMSVPPLYALTSATGALNATYANGTAGIGATLTDASGTFAAFANDGVTYSVGTSNTIWVNNQANPAQNGLYYLSRNGNGTSVSWQLTRATNFDTSAQMIPGTQINIFSGNSLASSIYVLLSPQPVNIGIDDITSESMLELAVANQPAHTLLGNPTGSTSVAEPITLGSSLSFVSSALSIAAQAADTLLGNPTGSSAVPTSITLGTGLAFVGSALTATGTSSPWVAGSGTNSAVGGDGTCTAAGNYSLCYGNSSSAAAGNNNYLFGANNTTVTGANDVFVAGNNNSVTSAISNNFMLGNNNTSNSGTCVLIGTFNQSTHQNGVAIGFSCTTHAANTMAVGNVATATNAGSYVWSDQNGTGNTDTAANQYVITAAGGFYNYVGSTLATSIDTNSNAIDHKGLADQSYSYQTPTTGFTITPAQGVRTLALAPAGTLATGTISLASLAPIDGQVFRVYSSQTITALTLSGATVNNAPTTLNAGQGFELQYNLANTAWNPTRQPTIAPPAITFAAVASNSQAMAVNTQYWCNNGATQIAYTLPSTAAIGTTMQILGYSSGGWTLAQNASQNIQLGTVTTTTGTGGSLTSGAASDCITLTCVVANTTWIAYPYAGNISYV